MQNHPTLSANGGQSRLVAAQSYAAIGWRVVPIHSAVDGRCSCRQADCGSPAKHPRTQHGVKDATTDPTAVAQWWRRWPDANIAVATGPESGVWMLGPDGEQGKADLAKLIADKVLFREVA